MGDFLCFAGTINFAIWKDWFLLLGINVCDLQAVVFNWHFATSSYIEIQVSSYYNDILP